MQQNVILCLVRYCCHPVNDSFLAFVVASLLHVWILDRGIHITGYTTLEDLTIPFNALWANLKQPDIALRVALAYPQLKHQEATEALITWWLTLHDYLIDP